MYFYHMNKVNEIILKVIDNGDATTVETDLIYYRVFSTWPIVFHILITITDKEGNYAFLIF